MGDRRSNFSQANIFFLVARLYQFAMYHSMLHRPSSTFLSLFSTTNLVRYYRRKPIHLAVKAPMLRDGKSIRINEVHRSLDHVQHLLEALWLKSPSGHNAIRVHNVMAASVRKLMPSTSQATFTRLTASPVAPIAFKWPKASRTQCTTRPCLRSVSTCEPPGMKI